MFIDNWALYMCFLWHFLISDESTETKEDSTNVIAIVVGSVLGGILIIGIVAFVLVLNYKRHTTKSGYVAN